MGATIFGLTAFSVLVVLLFSRRVGGVPGVFRCLGLPEMRRVQLFCIVVYRQTTIQTNVFCGQARSPSFCVQFRVFPTFPWVGTRCACWRLVSWSLPLFGDCSLSLSSLSLSLCVSYCRLSSAEPSSPGYTAIRTLTLSTSGSVACSRCV